MLTKLFLIGCWLLEDLASSRAVVPSLVLALAAKIIVNKVVACLVALLLHPHLPMVVAVLVTEGLLPLMVVVVPLMVLHDQATPLTVEVAVVPALDILQAATLLHPQHLRTAVHILRHLLPLPLLLALMVAVVPLTVLVLVVAAAPLMVLAHTVVVLVHPRLTALMAVAAVVPLLVLLMALLLLLAEIMTKSDLTIMTMIALARDTLLHLRVIAITAAVAVLLTLHLLLRPTEVHLTLVVLLPPLTQALLPLLTRALLTQMVRLQALWRNHHLHLQARTALLCLLDTPTLHLLPQQLMLLTVLWPTQCQ